jgi:hypothetical protein
MRFGTQTSFKSPIKTQSKPDNFHHKRGKIPVKVERYEYEYRPDGIEKGKGKAFGIHPVDLHQDVGDDNDEHTSNAYDVTE